MESQHDEYFFQDDSPVKAEPPCQEGVEPKGVVRPVVKRRKLAGRQSFVEGTAVGDGTRLVRLLSKRLPVLAMLPRVSPVNPTAMEGTSTEIIQRFVFDITFIEVYTQGHMKFMKNAMSFESAMLPKTFESGCHKCKEAHSRL